MIKVSTRHNLLYIILAIIIYNIRRINKMLFGPLFSLGNSLFFTVLMFIGEISTGFLIGQYQKMIFSKSKKNILSDALSKDNRKKIFIKDSNKKINYIIFLAAFFDFFEFSISVYYISKFSDISGSLELRLYGVTIIFSSIIHFFILKLKIFRHQLFSLIIIGICLIIIIISEIIITKDDVSLSTGNITLLIFLLFAEMVSNSLLMASEQYLLENDSITPHDLLLKEGIFGLIISFIGLINDNPFEKLIMAYNNSTKGLFALFIFLCFIYIVLSGIYNIYKIHVVSLYSPMTVSLIIIFLNPLFMIYDYFTGGDYIVKGKKNTFYFILNLVLSIITVISGCIFNDFLVVNYCGLGFYTYKEISERSEKSESERITELIPNLNDEERDSNNGTVTYNIYV